MTDQTLEQIITAWYTDDARGSHLDFDDVPALVKRLTAALPTREQIAFRLRQTAHLGSLDQAAAVLALLPHPTPTAEPWYERTPRTDEQFVADLLAKDSEPPRPEDMAPRTVDPFANRQRVRHLARRHDVIETRTGTWLLDWYRPDEPYIRKVDPSTIRDVTPPAVGS